MSVDRPPVAHGPRTVPPFQIPFSFFGLALAVLGGGCFWVLFGAPAPLGLLHLLALGVFATVAMGALYQFVPVVGMVKLRWPAAAFVHLVLAAAGTAGIVYGLTAGHLQYAAWGGGFHLAGACIQGLVLWGSLRKGKTVFPARFAAFALGWFAATAGTGLAIAVQLELSRSPSTLITMHPVLGLAGFYGTLITAVTFRLLKMFERINEEGRAPVRVAGVMAAVLIAIFAGRLGSIALILIGAVLVWDVLSIARWRNPAYQRETLWYSCVSFFGALAAAITMALGEGGLAVAIALWFFIGAAVVGYIQRIVPFIWWIQRARRHGAKSIPALKDLNQSSLGYAILALWCAAGILGILGIEHWAAVAGLAAWCALIVQLSRAFVLQKTR